MAEILSEVIPLPKGWEGSICILYLSGECSREAEWMVDNLPYCTVHKDEIVQRQRERVAKLEQRPANANPADLELLELIQKELEGFLGFTDEDEDQLKFDAAREAAREVIKELKLSLDDPEAWNVASWYLWQMGLIPIRLRARILFSVYRRKGSQ